MVTHDDIVKYMNRLGGSCAVIADRVGVSRMTVNSWYNGKNTPSLVNLQKILKECDADLTIVEK
jgi:transcriptional regulator with XRE-family HTH domain